MQIHLRSIFLTSETPATTAQFYERVALTRWEIVGNEDTYRYWRVDDGAMQIALHDAKLFSNGSFPAVRASNTTHLYFKIDDQSAFLKHLAALDVQPWTIDEVVVTVEDPDGRKVMFGTA